MRQTRFAGINIEAGIRLFILLGFALFFYVTIQSGKTQYYVHPRIVPYIKFAIAAMVLISVFSLKTIFKPRRRKASLLPYLLFIIPMMSAFLLPARAIDATSMSGSNFRSSQTYENTESSISSGDTDYSGDSEPADFDIMDALDEIDTSSEGTADITLENGTGDSSSSDAAAAAEKAAYGEDASALKLEGKTVVVGNDNFASWIDEIYFNTEEYKGRKIEITGMVFKDKSLNENGFGIVRLMMSCCAADLQPVGLICRYGRAGELNGNAWIKVTGIIDTEMYEGEETPVIKVDGIQTAEKPEDEYVYP